jgi:hypothetical protein
MIAGIGPSTSLSAWTAEPSAPRTGRRVGEAGRLPRQAGESWNVEAQRPHLHLPGETRSEPARAGGTRSGGASESEAKGAAGRAGSGPRSSEQEAELAKLRSRDAEVRAHEAAHAAAGGAHIRGGASFSYQKGPDGKLYAVGGEVGIDASPVAGNPQATISKMQQVRGAALAPANPSGADRAVAAKAAQTEARARQQLAAKVAKAYGAGSTPPAPDSEKRSEPGDAAAVGVLKATA